MIRLRALAVIAAAGLLTACTVNETRVPARIVMKGSPDKVLAQAVPATEAMHAQLHVTARDAQGMVEATLTLPSRTSGDKAFKAMTRCIDAKLSCAFHGDAVSREVRASLG